MTWMRWIAAVLVLAGALAIILGGFSYTKETHTADLGPLSLEMKERDRIDIPPWAGLLALVAGAGLWIAGKPRRPLD